MDLKLILFTILIIFILHKNVTFENFELCKEDTEVYKLCIAENPSDEREQLMCQSRKLLEVTCDNEPLKKEEDNKEEVKNVDEQGKCIRYNNKRVDDCDCGDDGISQSCCENCIINIIQNNNNISKEQALLMCRKFNRCVY